MARTPDPTDPAEEAPPPQRPGGARRRAGGDGEAALHATCVAVHGRGVVLTGPSGAGKSALGLQLIDGGAMLVSDDVTRLYRQGALLIARAPERGTGLIEARGNGFLRLGHVDRAPVALFVAVGPFDGDPAGRERLPEPAWRTELGISVPLLRADPRDPTAAALIRLAVAHGPPHIPAAG